MRKRIYNIIRVSDDSNIMSKAYDFFMMLTIFISLIPLTAKGQTGVLIWIDKITVGIFVIDYILRFITADYKLKGKALSFVKYPFTTMAIIDLVSILPSIMILNNGLKLLRIFRLVRTFKVFRVFKVVRYSKNIMIILNVFKKQKNSLIVVGFLAIGYILITALIVFNIEPDTFDNFFDAVYWATVSLTTVGYGDIYAVSIPGKFMTMVSAIIGIAIVALPAGIITAGYMEEVKK